MKLRVLALSLALASLPTLAWAADGPPRGTVVWNAKGALGGGTDRTWQMRGVKEGGRYLLKASGICTRAGSKGGSRGGHRGGGGKARKVPSTETGIFGIDFAASIEGGEAVPLQVGEGVVEHSEIPFVARMDAGPLRVWDRANLPKVRCKITDVQVLAQ